MPRFNTSDGLSLYYRDEGSGLPLLCLSGLTRNSSDFDYVAPHLSGLRLIRPDYRGRGQSDWAKDWTTYSIAREGQDAIELLDHLGIARAALLGTSRGGLISMALATTQKQRLMGVALNDIGPELESAGLAAVMSYLGRNPDWKTMNEAAVNRPGVMAGFANVPDDRWVSEVEKHYVFTGDGLTINYDPKLRDAVLAQATASAGTPANLWPLFDALDDLPLAIIRGANSDLLSQTCYTHMSQRRPDAIAIEIADRGHVPFLDEPEAVETLQTWLEQIK